MLNYSHKYPTFDTFLAEIKFNKIRSPGFNLQYSYFLQLAANNMKVFRFSERIPEVNKLGLWALAVFSIFYFIGH